LPSVERANKPYKVINREIPEPIAISRRLGSPPFAEKKPNAKSPAIPALKTAGKV